MASYDVAVVGGGIIGVTTAFFLARRGRRVVIVERGRLAQGTTDNSFAWINASSKAAHGDYHRLNALGLAGYNDLAAEFGEAALGLNPCGELSMAPLSDTTRLNALREKWKQLQDHGYPATWVHSKDLPGLEPSVNFDQDYEAVLNFGEHSLNAPHFARFMAEQVAALGGDVLQDTEALSLDLDDAGALRGLETAKGTLSVPKVILATGPDCAEQLARLTGFEAFASRFPVRRSPGLLLTTPDLSPHRLVRHVIYWDEDPDLHVLPHHGGGLKMGADDTDGLVAETGDDDARRAGGERLLARARQRIRGIPEDLRIEDCQLGIGVRPMPEDGQSIADALPGSTGLYLIATHSGVTLAPALGRLMAAYVDTGERPDTLAPFTLARFPGFS